MNLLLVFCLTKRSEVKRIRPVHFLSLWSIIYFKFMFRFFFLYSFTLHFVGSALRECEETYLIGVCFSYTFSRTSHNYKSFSIRFVVLSAKEIFFTVYGKREDIVYLIFTHMPLNQF